ncbi:antennal-specific protein OS-C [Drosophila sulfurigaster albostrigata]|uniref:Antennal-specific protein OS-C n=1 Tax=Drosophila albomicans TaxID=7291 RepID=A0A6P8Y043_DROAB|nr:antennal-specific protein OS-C [Drosophila albomicans]XP_062122989.1 antennal-specific protein OS-C [Drosophila sulfurigaster albostrigata]
MAFHVGRLLVFSLLILLLQLSLKCEARPKGDGDGDGEGEGDDDDSSSEETVEDSEERRRRRRDVSANNSVGGRAGIPGLPDPATIIKIAQLFQSVGEQIVPILLEAVLPGGEATGDRFTRDLQLLKNAKRSLELYSDELQSKAMN